MMKNKKGFEMSLENVLGLIIAIMVLVIVAPPVGAFFSDVFFGSDDKVYAQSQIEDLILEISSLTKEETYSLLTPSGWFLTKFSKTQDSPNECAGKNCLCLCPAKRYVGFISVGLNCDKGMCKPVEKEIKMNSNIKIPSDITIKVSDLIEIIGVVKSKVVEKKSELTETQKTEYASLDNVLNANYPSFGKLNLGSCIMQAETDFNIPHELIIAVALHESNKGTSGLAIGKSSIDGTYAYNLFGYKGVGTKGSSQWYTRECLKSGLTGTDIVGLCGETDKCGSAYNCKEEQSCYCVIANFRAYKNHCDSIRDFVNLISTSSRYKEALQYKDDINKMVNTILEGGYATDPKWAEQVIEISKNIQTETAGLA